MRVDPVRRRLLDRAAERGRSLANLSASLGRNTAYLHQFINRGSPRRLPEDDRRRLAMLLEVDERELGARDPWSPMKTVPVTPADPDNATAIRSSRMADFRAFAVTGPPPT